MPKGVVVALSIAAGLIACAFRTLEHFAALDFVAETARSPTLRWVREVSGLHSTVAVLVIVGSGAALFVRRACAEGARSRGRPPRRRARRASTSPPPAPRPPHPRAPPRLPRAASARGREGRRQRRASDRIQRRASSPPARTPRACSPPPDA